MRPLKRSLGADAKKQQPRAKRHRKLSDPKAEVKEEEVDDVTDVVDEEEQEVVVNEKKESKVVKKAVKPATKTRSTGPKTTRRKKVEIVTDFEKNLYTPDAEDERRVKEKYEEVVREYEKVKEEQGKPSWTASLVKASGVRRVPDFDVEMIPLYIPPEVDTEVAGKMKISLFTQKKNKDQVEPAGTQTMNVIPLAGSVEYPRMQYWTHTERNIRTDDKKVLSHIPYLGDTDGELDFGTELLDDFEDGIHGVNKGWGKILTDTFLYEMLPALEEEYDRLERSRSTLYETVHSLFPNKFTVKQLENASNNLRPRFEADKIPAATEPYMSAKESYEHSYDYMFCGLCCVLDCQLHDIEMQTKHNWNTHTKFKLFETEDKDGDRPCGPSCYRNIKSPKKNGNSAAIQWPNASQYFDKYLKDLAESHCGVESSCKLMSVIRHMLVEFGSSMELTCAQLYAYLVYLETVSKPKAEPEKPKKKVRGRDHHQIFRATRHKMGKEKSQVSTSRQVMPCNHPGQKCEPGICECILDQNVCTKFCQCEDCPHKFPGCKCTPGRCNTSQCSCYLANFECDPELCHECACDTPEAYTGPLCTNVQLQRGFQKKMLIGVSEIADAGWGCFVDEDVKVGELISEYCGEIISTDECERRGRIYDKLKCSYIFNLNDQQAVDATRVGNLIRFANHCEKPNCEPKVMIVNGDHRIGIYAKVDIKRGDEIFFNYSYDRLKKMQFVSGQRGRDEQVESKSSKSKGARAVSED